MLKTLDYKNGKLLILDQRLLPGKIRYIVCRNAKDVADCIKTLIIRGAPAIGVAAAYGVVLEAMQYKNDKGFRVTIKKAIRLLSESRPTARNLFWALERMQKYLSENYNTEILCKKILEEARSIEKEDKDSCRAIGKFGQHLIKNNDCILTHCNAGYLATTGTGTALSILYEAKSRGRKFMVYVDETRPLLQGARLTCFELVRHGIDVTVICDSMAANLMRKGIIKKVIVGADRIAANNDVANKIGTYGIAVCAKIHNIPFYVAAPVSTFDYSKSKGEDIFIEQREPAEVTEFCGIRITPKNVNVSNFAFDITPSEYITAIVTDKGIIKCHNV
jgi:methylthioribose-1-phosphate isomerase